MNESCRMLIEKALQASSVTKDEVLQPLWSGYGEVYRVKLTDAVVPSVMVKHINPGLQNGSHPRGWHSDASVQRKLKSYAVEQCWYEQYAPSCNEGCKVPTCYGSDGDGNERWIVLEDLDYSGYSLRLSQLSPVQCRQCLAWLAHFHALFLNRNPENLWPVGTYWHLATRQQEWHACNNLQLKDNAGALDKLLNSCLHTTLVHGDAKVANFCFAEETSQLGVAAVDFQYTGGGCGIRDVAYFFGSCLSESECQLFADDLLDQYFDLFKTACLQLPTPVASAEFQKIEQEWRYLYPVAWADFHRFLDGWSPDHQKINNYTHQQTHIALSRL